MLRNENPAMTAHVKRQIAKGAGTTWVGRAIRRLEDPALVAGHGRFTADLPATRWVRFVRSAVAAGHIDNIEAPADALVITAASLKGVKPILPMLHKFNYKPVGQPILADRRRAVCRRADCRGRRHEQRARRRPRRSGRRLDQRDGAGDRRKRGA